MKSSNIITTLMLALFSFYVNAQVPAQWDTARNQLISKLNQINTEVLNRWDNQPYCTDFGSSLIYASSNRGYALFTHDPNNYPYPIPAYQNLLYAYIDTMLMAFDTLGFTAVDLTLNYPLLVNSFNHSQHYLDFYKKVVNKIKQKGFKLTIECQAAFVDSVFGEQNMVNDIKSYYFNPDNNPLTDDTLDMYRFKQDKLQMLQTIIDSLKPDFLTLIVEPQTEQINLYNLIDCSPDSSASLVNYFLNHLQVNTGTTLIGAGAGSWEDMSYFTKLAQTNINFIDYHIYPPHFNYVNPVAFSIDSIADANNKKLIIGEAWCYKTTNYELQTHLSNDVIFSRDVFDYWQGVDTLFIKMLALLSQQSKIDLISMYWPHPFFGQLTYNAAVYGTMSPSQILNVGQQYAYQNMNKFILSPIGIYAKNIADSICNSTTGIAEYSILLNELQIYPNPTDDNLHIRAHEAINKVIIFDYMGKVIDEMNTKGKPILDMAISLPCGLYLVQVQTKSNIITKRILVSK